MFCANTSVSMALALATFCALKAVTKLKMVVNAGVIFWLLTNTFHIGWKPSAKVSFASAALS
jgi:hypothetical protein